MILTTTSARLFGGTAFAASGIYMPVRRRTSVFGF